MSRTSRISARTPHTTAVSPTRTTALPDECESEEVWQDRARGSEGRRPDGRLGGWLVRVARRKECGESLANVWAGKEVVEEVDEVLVAIGGGGVPGDRDLEGKTVCLRLLTRVPLFYYSIVYLAHCIQSIIS